MNIKALKIFLLIIYTTFPQTIAQKYRFTHLTVKDGLSNGQINCITQDSTGFIWIGTNDGLNRYDGYRFKIYAHKPTDTTSILTNVINDILVEGDNLWICTNKGIDFFDASKEIFIHIPIVYENKPINVSVLKAYKDFNGHLYIATHKGLYRYNSNNKQFTPYFFNNNELKKLKDEEITWISQDREGNFWIGTLNQGVFQYNINLQNVFRIEHNIEGKNVLFNNKIFCIYEDNQHTIWIGSNEGLFAYYKKNNSTIRFMPQSGRNDWLPHISVNRILEDSRNNLWLATNGGLSKYNRNKENFTNYLHNEYDETSLSNNSIHAIFEDFQKNIWIGSGENGLNIYKAQTIEFETFKKRTNNPTSLNYSYVLSVMEDSDGNVWIGTNGWGINKYVRSKNKMEYFLPPTATITGKQTGAILTIFEDKEGKIWISTYLDGVTVYNPKTGKYKTYAYNPQQKNSLSNNIVTHIMQDSKGNIWLSTNGGGINIYQPKTDDFKYIRASENNLTSDHCLICYEDKNGNIWIGTYFGLNKYNTIKQKNIQYLSTGKPGSISSDVIYAIYEDSKKQIWIGTEFGLNLYDSINNNFITFTSDNGLPNNVINGILEDNRGFLWISTNKGLCRFDPSTGIVISYDTNDGIASMSFYHGAYFKGKSGYFYFGGSEGVTYFNPDRMRNYNFKTPLVFTELYMYNQPVKPSNKGIISQSIRHSPKIELQYNQAFITLEFALLNYITSSKVNYSYYLEGIDQQWNYIGNQRTATYTNLPSGKYTLKIKAIDENGNENNNSIKIIVHPPFYSTTFAYIIYIIILFSIAYFIYTYIHSKTKYKHSLEIERLEKEKAIEINQEKLKFFINVSHEFKTPLTLILSPIEKLISKGQGIPQDELNYLYHLIYRNALRLYRLINQIMDIRKLDSGIIKINISENDIVEFTKEICLNFNEYARKHNIEFKISINQPLIKVWFDIDKIEKCIYNLLSNAFRHTPDGKAITVQIIKKEKEQLTYEEMQKYAEGYVSITVIDEGHGIDKNQIPHIFKRFYQVQTSNIANPTSSGIGLSLTKEFVEMHSGEIRVKSQLGEGSTFSIILPLGKSHFNSTDFVEQVELMYKPIPESIIENSENKYPTETKKKFKIIVVEDNYELRSYLVKNLEEDYQVFEAANGKQALQIIKVNYPDLIITDVMMPEMNGIELCKTLKSDSRYSHVPIIMLTVLNSLSHQLEGLETGADDYITKPFNINILKARIFNIIETRKKLVRRFIEDINSNVQQLAHNAYDERFLKKAIEVIEKNLSNTEFTAEDFAEQVGMSRSNLHIKLKALTQQSATEFIRLYRLRKAAELLTSHQYNVSEVSYMVGFNSISYFNRCFKQLYGLTPTEYVDTSKQKSK